MNIMGIVFQQAFFFNPKGMLFYNLH